VKDDKIRSCFTSQPAFGTLQLPGEMHAKQSTNSPLYGMLLNYGQEVRGPT
jgi:hypothetical protein